MITDEIPRQRAARRGFSVSYRGKTLLSVVDPIAQAERIAEGTPKLSRTLYFCPSPLYGYGLSRLLDETSADSAVLCVEADEHLMLLSEEAMEPLLRENKRLRLVRTGDPRSLCAYIRETWGSRRFRRVVSLRLSGGWQIAAELYDALADALRRDIAVDWGNAMTLVKLGRRYMRNALRNLSRLPETPGIADLDFDGAPALVLGAGPSLDGILEALSGRFGDLSDPAARPFKIICVDTALKALRDRRIQADLGVALECQHWNLRDFIGLGDRKIPLAMDLSALSATAGAPGVEPYLFFTPWASLGLFSRMEMAGLLPERFPPLGSVGLTATALALRLSSGQVITGGIDFSFTLDAFHARSTPGREEGLRSQNRFRSLINADAAFRPGASAVRSKNGLTLRSDPAMRGYRDLFEREFAGPDRAGETGRLLDINGPGLPLGTRIVEQDEAFAVLAASGTADLPAGAFGKSAGLPAGKPAKDRPQIRAKLRAFIREEQDSLFALRDILTGQRPADTARLETLLDRNDYLWAHFPDCAGTEGRRPPGTDISFLKRVRVEIDPCAALFDQALGELDRAAPPFAFSDPSL